MAVRTGPGPPPARRPEPGVAIETGGKLSWSLLDATLRAAPQQALRRCAIRARRHWDTMPPEQRRTLEAVEDLIQA